MAVEPATYIDTLNKNYPEPGSLISQADDHLRLIKNVLKTTFPNISNQVTPTQDELNKLTGFSGTVADLNYAKDLRATGVTKEEYDHLDGCYALADWRGSQLA